MSEMSDAIEAIQQLMGGEVEAYLTGSDGRGVWTTRYSTEENIYSHVRFFHAVYPAPDYPLGKLVEAHAFAHATVVDTAHHIPHAHKERP